MSDVGICFSCNYSSKSLPPVKLIKQPNSHLTAAQYHEGFGKSPLSRSCSTSENDSQQPTVSTLIRWWPALQGVNASALHKWKGCGAFCMSNSASLLDRILNLKTTYLLIGGAAPLPPIGGGTVPLAAERACKTSRNVTASEAIHKQYCTILGPNELSQRTETTTN